MQSDLLINNCVKMPTVCLGTRNLHGNECVDTVAKAISFGYRQIDTAQMHENEARFGGEKNPMQLNLFSAIKRVVSVYDLQALCIRPPFDGLNKFDYGLRKSLDPYFDWEEFGETLLRSIPYRTLMLTECSFGLHYAMFHIPGEDDAMCIVGPWATVPYSRSTLSEVMRHNLSESILAAVDDFYDGVLLLDDDDGITSILFALLSALELEHPFTISHEKEFLPLNFRPETARFETPTFKEDIPIAMLEERYLSERRLLEAVARGDEVAAFSEVKKTRRFIYNDRFVGSLFAAKNKVIILNTLLRKTLEQADVHPYYIDQISWRFSRRIEHITTDGDSLLIRDMIREYCAYARSYSLKDYSPTVQRVINHINLNLSSELSLKSLSAMCFISPCYLSYLFKQETNTTLTSYINDCRIQRAAHCLLTTELSVSAIAEQVGILDVSYFTKIFKISMGIPPTQYRKQHRE